MSNQEKMFQMCQMINNAAEIEYNMRSDNNDVNLIYSFYDRNKAISCYMDSLKGEASGTCESESIEHYAYLLNEGIKEKNIKCYRAKVYSKLLKSVIFHQYLVIKIDGKWYNESRANGCHKRIPQSVWLEYNEIVSKEKVNVKIVSIKQH